MTTCGAWTTCGCPKMRKCGEQIWKKQNKHLVLKHGLKPLFSRLKTCILDACHLFTYPNSCIISQYSWILDIHLKNVTIAFDSSKWVSTRNQQETQPNIMVDSAWPFDLQRFRTISASQRKPPVQNEVQNRYSMWIHLLKRVLNNIKRNMFDTPTYSMWINIFHVDIPTIWIQNNMQPIPWNSDAAMPRCCPFWHLFGRAHAHLLGTNLASRVPGCK